jgi:NDP-sugar pyrophosphorylase family protein
MSRVQAPIPQTHRSVKDAQNMKEVILHGRVGTKLRPLTHTDPKRLIPVAYNPNSQYVLEDLKSARMHRLE